MSIGQAYDQLYSPQGLLLSAAQEKTPVIYVAMNYRVNIFGYAASKALSEEGNTNMGLLDQYVALQWVRDNIAAFGGDPENVTIFGESDGATSVGMQLTAYGGERDCLFKRGIMESGGVGTDSGGKLYSNIGFRAIDGMLTYDIQLPATFLPLTQKASLRFSDVPKKTAKQRCNACVKSH